MAPKVYFALGVGEKPPHTTQIKEAANQIEIPAKPRLNRDKSQTIQVSSSGKPIFMTYQFQERDGSIIIWVKNAKWSTKRRKR